MKIEEYRNTGNYLWETKKYCYKDWKFTLSCNSCFTSDYLHAYLKTYFEEDNSFENNNWHIWVIVDNKLYSDFVSELDKEEDIEYCIWQEATGCITIENKIHTERWHIAKETMNHLGLMQDVYCRIRRTCISYIEKQYKLLLFHAACVSKDEEACIVLGDKGMGKSYLTNHLLYRKGWSYVAADHTIVVCNEDGILESRGNITSYRMEEKDFVLYQLKGRNEIISYRKDDNYVHRAGKINIPPSYLEDYFQIQWRQNVPLKTVLIITDIKYEINKMGTEEKINLLSKYLIHDLGNDEAGKKEYDREVVVYILRQIINNCNIYSVAKGYSFDKLYQEVFKESC